MITLNVANNVTMSEASKSNVIISEREMLVSPHCLPDISISEDGMKMDSNWQNTIYVALLDKKTTFNMSKDDDRNITMHALDVVTHFELYSHRTVVISTSELVPKRPIEALKRNHAGMFTAARGASLDKPTAE